ncbi:molecular chaperone [Aeromonas media]|uniref:Molecular chaperone n=1 Tax=Aeromonas media TaxID=651 RepID=A0AAW5RTV8_AERME|nr:molecular chaperone [Aeromonas media]MCV3290488.1 molecular chaperone [Aeromonas media]
MQNDTAIARLLGALLYHSPNSETVTSILHAVAGQEGTLLQPLSQLALEVDADELEADFFRLLQGDGEMPCPPWGSAYLDPENALFGSSTLEFRAFLTEVGIQCDTGMREPEDHIGLMLMGFSVLLERGEHTHAAQLLTRHLMPFAPSMLASMEKHASTDFYRAIAACTLGWLNLYCEEADIQVATRPCYWEKDIVDGDQTGS